MLLKEENFKGGEIRVKCKGTIAAEFWKKDVENIFTDKDRFVKVLEITESQWPSKFVNYSYLDLLRRTCNNIIFTNLNFI